MRAVDSPQGRTPLLLAVEKQQTSCVEVLSRLGADVNAATKVFRMTPLILAAERGYADIVNILLCHGAEINHKDMRGMSPGCLSSLILCPIFILDVCQLTVSNSVVF